MLGFDDPRMLELMRLHVTIHAYFCIHLYFYFCYVLEVLVFSPHTVTCVVLVIMKAGISVLILVIW
jgi:hypothetical protein